MKKIEAYADIKDGAIQLVHKNRFYGAIKCLKDGKYKLTIERAYRRRSNPQNAFLWGVAYPIILSGMQDSGYENLTVDDVHDLLKFKFLRKDLVSKHGEVIEGLQSTAKLTTSEFMDYMSEVGKWAAEYLNVYIPEPNEINEAR